MDYIDKKHNFDIIPAPGNVEILKGYCTAPENIVYKNTDVKAEAYLIGIENYEIAVSSSSESGRFYAQKTLEQLKKHFAGKIPCMRITDAPQYHWRGLHLDVSRHFFSVSTIKNLLTVMSQYKLNRFHWHLNDDQGWRIQIDKYPLLTEKGACRLEDSRKNYEGSYTKDEIKEVIDFAENLFIEIIPEIELPGHARAAISAYPHLSCTKEPLPVPHSWGVFEDVYCPGKDETVSFLKDVLSEIAEIFPSQWIHIGGDECPTIRWKKCTDCQKRMKTEGLKSERQLQEWLINNIAEHLKSIGKTAIGWDEIISDGLDEEVAVMIWRGDGIDAQKFSIEAKRKMVMSPNFYCYFDWKQTDEKDEKGSFGVTPLSKVYNYDPVNGNNKYRDLVMGLQGNIWTERIVDEEELFYMAFPRALAIAENGWSACKKDLADFKRRCRVHVKFLEEQGFTPCNRIE